jgi:hypothetical protein
MCRPKIKCAVRAVAAATALGALLAGCSDVYYDRRETLALGADDAVASNMVEQMVDPWPRYSNNNNIAFNGQRMQRAVECYRKDQVTPPVDLDPSDDSSSPPPAAPALTPTACGDQTSSSSAQGGPGTTLGSTTTAAAAK